MENKTQDVDRRLFLKSAAILGGVAAAGMVGCASDQPEAAASGAVLDEALVQQLKDLVAKEAIREKIVAYARSMDRIDRELGYSLFAKDSMMDYGDWYTGHGPGFIDVVCDYHTAYATAHQHHMNNITIQVNGDKASSETYVDMVMRLPDADGKVVAQNVHGRYFDEWVYEDGQWLMKFRTFVRDLGSNDFIAPEADMGNTGGSRDGNDYSYANFAKVQ